jgi:zinc transport system substrate-binding protein
MKDFRNVIFVLVVAVFLLQMFVTQQDAKNELQSESNITAKPIVSLSTFSLYDIAKHIAGESVELVMILPFGVDAHSFEPTPTLMSKIYKSALVVYSGAGLEPWIDGFEFKHAVVDMSEYVNLRELESDEQEGHAHHDHQCAHNKIDPHYWLDVQNMILSAEIITEELIKILPQNRDEYISKQNGYITMLKDLDKEYRDRLASCRADTLIVNHNAFSYISNKYGFEIEALSGFSPEAEPSAKNMARLIEHIKEHKVSTIFFESFVSDRAIRSIADDTGIKVDVLQPLGNITADEAAQNLTYENIMKINLRKIAKALECR